jgi:hypothetical protein
MPWIKQDLQCVCVSLCVRCVCVHAWVLARLVACENAMSVTLRRFRTSAAREHAPRDIHPLRRISMADGVRAGMSLRVRVHVRPFTGLSAARCPPLRRPLRSCV